jgi:hypothetical protein
MKYEAWSSKAVEGRIIEMADTLRLLPRDKGPQAYGNAMPEIVRRYDQSYGHSVATSRKTASAASLARMEQVWGWVNDHLCEADRKLIYAWSWVKVRKGLKISAFAEENDMNDRFLRREIVRVCQQVANNLNRISTVRLNSEDCAMSENEDYRNQSTVTSNNCGTIRQAGIAFGRTEDATPILNFDDPELASRIADGNAKRARELRRRAKLQMEAA